MLSAEEAVTRSNRKRVHMPYDGSKMLLDAATMHGIRLSLLVAETGLWANPDVHNRLVEKTGSAARYPNVRRVRVGRGERRGQVVDGIRMDDNTYANRAIKEALGLERGEVTGFETCHIWPKTCYDPRYHTAIANLVLLPRALAGLADHDREIQAVLKYRAFELYNWNPDGVAAPQRPDFYPSNWLAPVRHGRNRKVAAAQRRGAAAQPPRQPARMSQRSAMRALYRRYGGNRERVVREYVSLEERGEVLRNSNAYGLSAVLYAERLFADGTSKGWLTG